MVGRQDLFFLRFRVSTFRFENTMSSAIFAPVLLTATRIVTIFHDVLALTISTFVNHQFCYHGQTILQITSTSPLPNYYAPLLAAIDHAVEEGFIFREHREALFCESDLNKLLDVMSKYEHPYEAVKRWLREE